MRLISIVAVIGAVIFAFQNCAKTNFSGSLTGDANNIGLGVDGANPVSTDGPVICDPLGGGAAVSNKNGLVGNLYYVPLADQSKDLETLDQVTKKAVQASGTIFMSQMNVPTRSFVDGFAPVGGEPIKDDAGNKLIEYFGLRMQTELALADADEEGTYQLATISDDGMIVYTGSDSAPTVLVGKYDKVHPTRSDCGAVTFNLKKGDRLPLNLIYYQGPRERIAAVLAWRKVADASSLDEKGCNVISNDDFFATTADQSSPWEQMASVGWKVVPSGNLWLPKTAASNPCSM